MPFPLTFRTPDTESLSATALRLAGVLCNSFMQIELEYIVIGSHVLLKTDFTVCFYIRLAYLELNI
jgi:hypothetical protein